ncbi:hypothetical protein CI238_11351 [Colletotrichum incanum]|uniref:Uncharacterized protein n=1 Tax=Colletotrichum incanum TaxID=1573173 RepID=A0A167AZX9_COLIC|nr:hypothetical protein CI238_11351 [Colletotrichum incanum]
MVLTFRKSSHFLSKVKCYYREKTRARLDRTKSRLRKRGRPRKGQRIAVRQSPRVNTAYLSQKEKDY